jgi:hypothetical protein
MTIASMQEDKHRKTDTNALESLVGMRAASHRTDPRDETIRLLNKALSLALERFEEPEARKAA